MQSPTQAFPVSNKNLWAGRVISAIPVLLMLFAAFGKLIKATPVVQGMAQFGYPERLVSPIGILELVCTITYVVPRTTVLGAILLTGLLGGATATNVRIGDPTFIMPVAIGIMVWAGIFLRDARIRALIPLRS